MCNTQHSDNPVPIVRLKINEIIILCVACNIQVSSSSLDIKSLSYVLIAINSSNIQAFEFLGSFNRHKFCNLAAGIVPNVALGDTTLRTVPNIASERIDL